MKYLVIGPSWIGDMTMAQSLYKLLKHRDPNCEIDVLAPEWCRALTQHMPEVNNAITLPVKHGEIALLKRYRIAKQIRQKNYDHAIVIPRSMKSALIPWLAKIPKRTGWVGEQRWGMLNDIRRLDKNKYVKVIERYCALGLDRDENLPSELFYPELIFSADELKATQTKFDLKSSNKPVIAICPGAEYGPAKRWPAHHVAELCKSLAVAGYTIWLLGSEKDHGIADDIQQLSDNCCVDFTGKTNLSEAVHLLALANVVLSNDSGLMHLAAAVKTPVVAIYGSSDPEYTPPLSKKATIVSERLLCSPCFKRECPLGHYHCLERIQPQRVLTAIEKASHT